MHHMHVTAIGAVTAVPAEEWLIQLNEYNDKAAAGPTRRSTRAWLLLDAALVEALARTHHMRATSYT